MANITNFLPVASYRHIEGKKIVATNLIDFSKKAAASGDTVDVLRIPKGAIVTEAGIVVHTTQATVTIAVGDSASANQYLAAQTLTNLKANNNAGTADGAAITSDATVDYKKFYGNEDVLRLTIGGAAATSAKVTAFCEYFIIPGSAS